MIDGEKSQLKTAGDSDLGKNICEVMLNCSFADGKRLPDFAVRPAARYFCDDFPLPWSQSVILGRACPVALSQRLAKYFHEHSNTAGVQPVVSGHDASDALKEHLRSGVSQNHTVGSQLKGVDQAGLLNGGDRGDDA